MEASEPCGWPELTRTPSTISTTLSFFMPRNTGFCPQAPSLCTASPGLPRNRLPAGAAVSVG